MAITLYRSSLWQSPSPLLKHYHAVEQVTTVLQGETQRGVGVHRRDTTENTRAVNASTLSVYSSSQPVEAAGIEPRSDPPSPHASRAHRRAQSAHFRAL